MVEISEHFKVPKRMLPSGRFVLVDALRGLAALSVVLYHLREGGHTPDVFSKFPGWMVALVDNGNLGVAVFFVLSGFVISHSIYDERVSASFVWRFALRRSLRLDPPYWIAIILSLAFAFMSAKLLPDKVLAHVYPGQIMAHLVYLQDILGYPPLNAVFWTLCLEVQFYLVYVVLLAIGRNDPDVPMQGCEVMIIFGIAATISLLWPAGWVNDDYWSRTFLPLWHAFLLGVGAYWSWRNLAMVPFFLIFVLAITISSIVHQNIFSIACVVTASLLFGAAITGHLFTAFNWTWLQFLGAISYSLYLTHNLIIGASFRVIYMVIGNAPAWEPIAWILSLSGCIMFATAMWWMIEKPSTRLSRKVKLSPASCHKLRKSPIELT